jgi:hypothetical protein
MVTDQRLLEMAINGLRAEQSRIEQEIADLTAQIQGTIPEKPSTRRRRARTPGRKLSQRSAAPRKRGITAAGRKRLSESAKRRWAANRKAGKKTL